MFLTSGELSWTYQALKLYSRVGLLPLSLDKGKDTIKIDKLRRKRLVFWICQLVLLIHFILMVVNFITLYRSPRRSFPNIFSCNIIFLYIFVGYLTRSAAGPLSTEFVQYHKYILQFLRENEDSFPGQKKLSNMLKYSRQQAFCIFLVPVILLGTCVYVCIPLVDPSVFHYTFNSVPSQYKSPAVAVLCSGLDFCIALIWWAPCTYAVSSQMLTFEVVICKMNECIKKIGDLVQICSDEKNMLYEAYMEFRRIQLQLQLLNHARGLMFCEKLVFLFLSISTLSTGIYILHTEPPRGVVYTTIGFLVTFPYPLIHEKAFQIPLKMTELRKLYRLRLRFAVCRKDRQFLDRCVQSIPSIGIRVGNRALERESAPIFVDFVLSTVVNLLISFHSG